MIRLTKRQVLLLHEDLIRVTGGSRGIRDEHLLASALDSPFQSFDEVEIFPSLQQKAARLGYGLVSNHPFMDGNKRIGAHVMLTFLALNGIHLTYTQDELSDVFLEIAAGKRSYEQVLSWIVAHQK